MLCNTASLEMFIEHCTRATRKGQHREALLDTGASWTMDEAMRILRRHYDFGIQVTDSTWNDIRQEVQELPAGKPVETTGTTVPV